MTDAVLRTAAAHLDVDADRLDIDAPLVVDAAEQRHLVRALRLRTGETVTVTDRHGRWRPMTAVVDGDTAVLEPSGEVVSEPLPSAFAVAVAIPKGDRLEWMVQKLTELGTARIVLLHADRSVVRWSGAKVAKGSARLQRVITAACRQSRRVRWPELIGPMAAREVLPTALAADPDGVPLPSIRSADLVSITPMLTVAVGPEGGWSEDELARAATTVRLGPHVLRTETAAVAAASLLAVMDSFPSVRPESLE